jgi:hypothetical protein
MFQANKLPKEVTILATFDRYQYRISARMLSILIDSYRSFSQSLNANTQIVNQIRPQLLLSTSFRTLFIILFDVIYTSFWLHPWTNDRSRNKYDVYILFGSCFNRHAIWRHFQMGVGRETTYTKFLAKKIKTINSNLWLVSGTIMYNSRFLNVKFDRKKHQMSFIFVFTSVFHKSRQIFLISNIRYGLLKNLYQSLCSNSWVIKKSQGEKILEINSSHKNNINKLLKWKHWPQDV